MAVGRIGVNPEKEGGEAVVGRKDISSEGLDGEAIMDTANKMSTTKTIS